MSPVFEVLQMTPPQPQAIFPSPALSTARSDATSSAASDRVIDELDESSPPAPDVSLDELGQVVCLREASLTTQNVRRCISSVLNEDSDPAASHSLQSWATNPFGFGLRAVGLA